MSEMNRIELILSELLVLAKPQVAQFQPVLIHDLLHQVVALLNTQAIMNNIQIVTQWDSNPIRIVCDENQIKQLLINLLKNAIEVMPSGGDITLNLIKKDEQVLISVIDQGCGIPEDLLAQIGTPFYSTKENGTGLGLMICRKIVDTHKGDLLFESQVDVGTTITVALPLVH
ncbi:Sporulation kinase A [compost metagenome]